MNEEDITRILGMAEVLSDSAHHRLMQMDASEAHACPVEFEDHRLPGGKGCRLTAEEHHRLAYGLLADNKELRRRLAVFENGAG